MTKSFPIFDCDAHVHEPPVIWQEYLSAEEQVLVRDHGFWSDPLYRATGLLNGTDPASPIVARSPITILGGHSGGAGNSTALIRTLRQMNLSDEQLDDLEHAGSFNAHARVEELDACGIDQVLVIYTGFISSFPFVRHIYAARALARAYNDWLADYCSVSPDRLFGAALIPLQSGVMAADEVYRVAEKGFKVVLVRPIDVNGRYPNVPDTMPFWRACEDTGVVVGMHTFIAQGQGDSSGRMYSPGELSMRMAQATGVRQTMDSQEISFMYEAITWTNGVLLSGFLDRFPRLKMAIFESNATWLPFLLDRIDRVHRLTPPQQRLSQRLPSEAFREQMMIAFEGDEEPVFRMWDYFEDHAIWSSDHYHHDAMDAWTALGVIEKTGGVPQEVVEKLMGGNARRFYGIEPKLYVTEQRDVDRPGWWPTPEQVDAASTPEAAVDAGLRFRLAGGARSLHEQPDQYLPYHRKKPTERV